MGSYKRRIINDARINMWKRIEIRNERS